MKEKLINLLVSNTYSLRKLIDKVLFKTFLDKANNWHYLDKYKNQPLLIVGNGPSLNKTPIDELKITSIGMNKINLLYDKVDWRPEMIVCTNGLVIKQNKEFFNATESLIFVPIKAYYLGVKNRKNVFFLNLVDEKIVNNNIEKKISSGCTVTWLCLQLAAYLNPTEVSIVGVDHNFNYDKNKSIYKMEGDDENHFSKDYFKGQYWGIPDLVESENLYKLSKDFFENKRNIKIIDYTVNGKLRIFQRKPINDLLKKYAKK